LSHQQFYANISARTQEKNERSTFGAIKDLECRTWRVRRVNVICLYGMPPSAVEGYLVCSAAGNQLA
jgi:hypothetical protein